ncbi:MAG: hypothetical protein IPH88_18115 [Bacteroidales bacterium]|nr:hypothetical protein [Bacteroidales bacterium]
MITVCLGKNSPPYSYEYVITDIGLPRNGIFTISLPPGSTYSYYLVVKHRNSIETWSSYPVSLHAGQTTYNFTNGAQKAYGYNLNQVGSVWVIYGGDVDQDGIVDSSDMIPTENQTSSFSMGYLPEDVNGDGLIDSSDMILIENNVSEFVTKVVPF